MERTDPVGSDVDARRERIGFAFEFLDAALWNALGEVNYPAGRIEVAESAFEKALEIDAGFYKPSH